MVGQPFFDEQGIRVQRILADRGNEYCGNRQDRAYQLYLTLKDVVYNRTKVNSSQTNGFWERFHKTT